MLRVAHVEDDQVWAKAVQLMLGELVQLVHFERAADLHSTDFDILLLDLNLQDSLGEETIRKARAGFPNLPIVVLTAIEDEEIHALCRELGCSSYVKGEAQASLLLREMRASIKAWVSITERQKELIAHREVLEHVKSTARTVQCRIDDIIKTIDPQHENQRNQKTETDA